MKRWGVVTPEYDYTEPILDDGSGPNYSVRDYIEVEARTKRDAIILGVRAMTQAGWRVYPWVYDQRSDNCCPFTGVIAERI